MKKLIPVLFALVLILVFLPPQEARGDDYTSCTICGQSNVHPKQRDNTYHEWICDNPSCDYYGESYAITGHSSTANCTDAGKCPVCGYSPMPALGHTGGEATCTTQAVCTRCGQAYGDYAAHSFTNYVSNNDATCTADGTKTATCDICKTATDTIPDAGSILPHSFTNYISNNDATCTADGTKTATCDICKTATDTVKDEGSALGHNLGEWSVNPDKKPTCTEKGEEIARCTRCDYLETREAPALGHKLVKTEKVEPTCEEDGAEAYWTCSVCKLMFSDEKATTVISNPIPIPSTGNEHKPGKPVKENVKEADCTHDGGYDEVVYCTICGKGLSREHIDVKATGHDWQPYEYHVTLTRFYYICKNCGRTQWIHNKDSLNMKPGLIRYANGDAVDYKASATGPDRDGILTIMPIKHTERDSTDDISLYMTPDDVYVWVWEKMNRIELVRDGVTLALDPREITPEMFGLKEEEKPDYYIFTLTPSGKDGWLVKAEALMGEKRIPAEELKGITLTVTGKEIEITANGVYTGE